ncbi:MAG: hypothetical protein PVJ60_07110, partial [Phycisphaerales bacterium]
MLHKRLILITILLLEIGLTGLQAQTDSIDYFGQTPPEDTPVVFAPGIISLSGRCEYATVFSPDGNECYIHRYIGDT